MIGFIFGIVTILSQIVTDAQNQVLSAFRGKKLVYQATSIEVAAADSDTSVYKLFRIPSNAVIATILLANDAITGGTAFELGLYSIASKGGAVVSGCQALFGSTLDLSSAHAFTDYTYEATATDIDKCDQPVWKRAGLTEDPGGEFDISLYATTVGTAAGTIAGRISYAI